MVKNDGEDRDELELTGVQDATFIRLGTRNTHIKVTTYIYQASFAGERAVAADDSPRKGTRGHEDGAVENLGRYSGRRDEIVVPRCRRKLR